MPKNSKVYNNRVLVYSEPFPKCFNTLKYGGIGILCFFPNIIMHLNIFLATENIFFFFMKVSNIFFFFMKVSNIFAYNVRMFNRHKKWENV
jgi:hypothetical protein